MRGFHPREYMKKILLALLALVLVVAPLPPITRAVTLVDFFITPTPDAIVAGGSVDLNVTITVNSGNSGQSISDVALYLEGGDAPIASWSRIGAGRTAEYTVTNLFIPVSQLGLPFPVVLKYKDFDGAEVSLRGSFVVFEGVPAAPNEARLTFLRTANVTSAKIGSTVNFTYSLRNDGLVDVTDIEISDELTGPIATIARLIPGQREEYIVAQRAMQDMTSIPKVSYVNSATGQRSTASIEPLYVPISNPKLTVALKSDVTQVKSGEMVTLSCTVFNEGNISFQDIQISDDQLGMLPGITLLAPDNSYVCTKKIMPVNSMDLTFVVAAKDPDGATVTVRSNTISIVVEDAPQQTAALSGVLTLRAVPDLYTLEEPGKVNFTITIGNTGATALKDVTLSEVNAGPLPQGSWGEIAPAVDKVYPYSVQIDVDKNFVFTVEGKTADGQRVQATTDAISIGIKPVALPTPLWLTPTPSEAPVSSEGEGDGASPSQSGGNGLLVALAIVGVLIGLCVILLIIFFVRDRSGRKWEQHSATAYEDDTRPDYDEIPSYHIPPVREVSDEDELTRPVAPRRHSNAQEDARTRPVDPKRRR